MLNRPTLTEYLTDATSETLTYDPFGNQATASNGTLSYSFTYDDKNRLLGKTDSRSNKRLTFGYDAVDNLITKTDYQNETTDFQYDSANRLVSMRNPAYLKALYQYDPAGRLLTRVLSDGVSSAFSHDANGRLTALSMQSANGSPVTSLSYTHDRVGHITQATGLLGAGISDTRNYTYDALYRLTQVNANGTANDESFTYDAIGNRSTHTLAGQLRTYQYQTTSNRLTTVRTGSATGPIEKSFLYDDEGRLTTQTGTGAKTLSWDQKNRARQMISGANTNTFTYDPMDYRIGRSGGTLGNRDYYLEGEHLEAEYQNSGLLAKYFRGISTDELIAGFTATGGLLTPSLYHHDQLTSVTGVTAHDGQSQQGLVYSAFGAIQTLTGSSQNRLRYTGREIDPDTSLYYYRARYYDPAIGRFLSEDPIGFDSGDVNFYAYVNNNPVNANDPSGKILLNAAGAAAGAVYGGIAGSISGTIVGLNTLGPNARFQDYLLAGSVGFATGAVTGAATGAVAGAFLNPALAASAPVQVASGVVGGVFSNIGTTTTQQAIKNQPIAPLANLDLSASGSILTSAIGGAAAVGTLRLGTGLVNSTTSLFGGQQFATTALTESVVSGIGAGVGEVSTTPTPFSVFNDFGNPNLGFPSFAGTGGASGGFLLYPNKSNSNQLRSVYRK
jgi:RHS repeat-associated protein